MSSSMLPAIFLAAVVTVATGCSPEGFIPMTVTQRVHNADAVLYGRITRTFPDTRWDSAYTAEMMVYCVLKESPGLVIAALVNITEAGFVPGMCTSTTLEVDGEYILTLREFDGRIIPNGHQIGSDQLDEAASTCGITPHFPQGISDGMCPDAVDEDSCTVYEEPTRRPRPTPRGPKPPMPNPPDMKDSESEAKDTGMEENDAATMSPVEVAGAVVDSEPENDACAMQLSILVALLPVALAGLI